MCGCKLMQAAINQDGNQTAPRAGNVPAVDAPFAAASASNYKCPHCRFPLGETRKHAAHHH